MLIILIIFITGLVAMFSGLFSSKRTPIYIGIAGVVIALICLHFSLGIGMKFPAFFSEFPLTKIMSAVALIILLAILIVQRQYEQDYDWAAVVSLLLFSTCGVLLLFGQRNLLTTFLGIEIMSIPLYVMAASSRHRASSLEAGLKYFIMGSFASAFLLFGIALVYGTTGSFVMDEIIMAQSLRGTDLPSYFYVGVAMILVSILFKMAMAPLHFWAPDVYDGSPTVVTTYMTTIVKLASATTMYYLTAGFFLMQFDFYYQLFLPIICISLLLGSIMGLLQHNVKRMMAYSGITHIAFVLIAIIIGNATKDFSVFLFYLLAYTFANVVVFSILDILEQGQSVFIDHLNGLKSRQPIVAVCFAIAVLSMAGIPFTGGFLAKFKTLLGAYQLNKWIFGLALLSSAIAIGYYLRLLHRVFFYNQSEEKSKLNQLSLLVISVLFTLSILLMGIFPEEILQGIHKLFVPQ